MATSSEADEWSSVADSSHKTIQENLSDLIIDSYAYSKFDAGKPRPFLPAKCIEKLVTLEVVIKELEAKDRLAPGDLVMPEGQPKKRVVDFVLRDAKKVFAIAVLSNFRGMELKKVMWRFMNIKFTDTNGSLPVTETRLIELVGGIAPPWNRTRVDSFCDAQWRFLAPVFSKRKFTFNLKPEEILPFTEKSNSVYRGAFGQVFAVQIHPEHQEDPIKNEDGSLAKIAIKEFIIPADNEELQKEADRVWKSEVKTLDAISEVSHPHLIQRIAAITRGTQRCLMMLWADGGDLRQYWTKHPKPVLTVSLVKDIIEQLRGMAEALKKLHAYSGEFHYRHGDIKPENILIFPDLKGSGIGTFKISDLGSAKDHAVATGLRPATGDKHHATMIYQPPESITRKKLASSRLGDIWSMGCVTLELMVWLLYGYEELKLFCMSIKGVRGEQSWFFEEDAADPKLAHVHPRVQACLDHLSKDPECTEKTALGNLLEIVKTKLLVVQLPEHRPSIAPPKEPAEEPSKVSVTVTDAKTANYQRFGGHRASAAVFLSALNEILRGKSERNESYWFTGRSRDHARPLSMMTMTVIQDQSSRLAVPAFHKPISSSVTERTKSLSSANFVEVPIQVENIPDVGA